MTDARTARWIPELRPCGSSQTPARRAVRPAAHRLDWTHPWAPWTVIHLSPACPLGSRLSRHEPRRPRAMTQIVKIQSPPAPRSDSHTPHRLVQRSSPGLTGLRRLLQVNAKVTAGWKFHRVFELLRTTCAPVPSLSVPLLPFSPTRQPSHCGCPFFNFDKCLAFCSS